MKIAESGVLSVMTLVLSSHQKFQIECTIPIDDEREKKRKQG